MRRKLYGTNKLVDAFTANLIKVITKDDGWSSIYLDESTEEEWLEYVVDPDRGYFRNLMLLTPKPAIDELVEIAFESEHEDEVYAAAKRIQMEGSEDVLETRKTILSQIQKLELNDLSIATKKRIETIIKTVELDNLSNPNAIIGKSIKQINQEYNKIREIAHHAELILKKLQN